MESKMSYRWEESAGLGKPPRGIVTQLTFLQLSNKQYEKRHIRVRNNSVSSTYDADSGANGCPPTAELVTEYRRSEDAERLGVTPSRRRNKGLRSYDDIPEPLAEVARTEDVDSDPETPSIHVKLPKIHQPLSVAQKRALKKEVKTGKSISKAIKNQRKRAVTVCGGDIQAIAQAIHSSDYGQRKISGNALATNKTIEEVMKRNLGFVSSIQEHRSGLLQSLAKERDSRSKNRQLQRSEDDGVLDKAEPKGEVNELVAAVLAQLGIPLSSPTLPFKSAAGISSSVFGSPRSGKKTQTAILHKFSTAIAEDIRNHEHE
jgi:hypothetical protein